MWQILKKKKKRGCKSSTHQKKIKNLTFEMVEPTFSNNPLPRHYCHWSPQSRDSGCRPGPHGGPLGWVAGTSSQKIILESPSQFPETLRWQHNPWSPVSNEIFLWQWHSEGFMCTFYWRKVLWSSLFFMFWNNFLFVLWWVVLDGCTSTLWNKN